MTRNQLRKTRHNLMVGIITSLSLFVLLPFLGVLFNAPDSWIDNRTIATFGLYLALAFNAIAIPVLCCAYWYDTHK